MRRSVSTVLLVVVALAAGMGGGGLGIRPGAGACSMRCSDLPAGASSETCRAAGAEQRPAAGAPARGRQQARAVRPRGDAALLRAAGQGDRAGGGQRLRLAAGADALALRGRSVLRAVLRHQQMPPRVQQSLGSGVLVDRERHRRHQLPRHPRRRRGEGRDVRRPRIRRARCCSRTSRSTSPC